VTGLDIAAMRKLLATATPGPWCSHDTAMMHVALCWPNNVQVLATMADIEQPHGLRSSANRELIVAAVNALPALLDAVEERDRCVKHLRVERDALQVANSVEFDRAEAAEAALERVRALCEAAETAFEDRVPDALLRTYEIRAAAALPEDVAT
jgi:hypothetical protein